MRCEYGGGWRGSAERTVEDREDSRTNEEILKKVEDNRSLMNIIRKRQKNWIGGNSLQREIMEGRMEGKRGRGRPRQKLMDWMMEDGYWKVKEKTQH